MDQAERLGEEGKLDESEALMKEIDRLKMQRSELSSMSENPLLQQEKQSRVRIVSTNLLIRYVKYAEQCNP